MEPPVQALKPALGFLIGPLATIHLQEMVGCCQCLTDARKIGAEAVLGQWLCGQTMRMRCILAGLVEFSLQVLLGDRTVPQGHPNVFMPEQLHQRWEADSQAQHFSREIVTKHVRCQMAGATSSLSCLHQSLVKGFIELVVAVGAWQQQALRIRQMGGRSGGAQGEDPLYDSPCFIIGGNQAIVVQLAQGDVQCPLVWAQLPQAVERQINAFADADSDGTCE